MALTLAPFAAWMKIGLQLFTAEGPDLVRAIRETGAKVFLDPGSCTIFRIRSHERLNQLSGWTCKC